MRTCAVVAAAFLFVVNNGQAQTVESSAKSPNVAELESGLLLGLSNGRGGRTLWIVRESDSIRLAWQTPHLIVPRAEGYWFVVSGERCHVDLGSSHGGGGLPGGIFIDRRLAVDIARAGTTVNIPLEYKSDCTQAAKRAYAARARAYRAALKAAGGDSTKVAISDQENDGLDCTVGTDQVTFLSATAISIEHRYSQTEFCSPGGYATSGSNSVLRIGTNDPIPLRPLLASDIRENAEKERGGEEGCAFDDKPERLDDSWIVHRNEGRWVADLFLEGPNACRGGSEYDLNLPLPSTFSGEGPLPMEWNALARDRPGLSDAMASPSGAFIALRAEDSITVHRLRGGKIAERIGRISAPWTDPAVMIRWATPAEAARWSRELPRLVAPKVRVVTPR